MSNVLKLESATYADIQSNNVLYLMYFHYNQLKKNAHDIPPPTPRYCKTRVRESSVGIFILKYRAGSLSVAAGNADRKRVSSMLKYLHCLCESSYKWITLLFAHLWVFFSNYQRFDFNHSRIHVSWQCGLISLSCCVDWSMFAPVLSQLTEIDHHEIHM